MWLYFRNFCFQEEETFHFLNSAKASPPGRVREAEKTEVAGTRRAISSASTGTLKAKISYSKSATLKTQPQRQYIKRISETHIPPEVLPGSPEDSVSGKASFSYENSYAVSFPIKENHVGAFIHHV